MESECMLTVLGQIDHLELWRDKIEEVRNCLDDVVTFSEFGLVSKSEVGAIKVAVEALKGADTKLSIAVQYLKHAVLGHVEGGKDVRTV